MSELKFRLEHMEELNGKKFSRIEIENIALQVRKIIEVIAFSSITLHRKKYSDYRSEAGNNYETDWNAKTIFNTVTKVNGDYYPISLNPEFSNNNGAKHFDRIEGKESYNEKQLVRLYDRCGGLLHACNPWGEGDSKFNNFGSDIPKVISGLRKTFAFHAVVVNHFKENASTALIIILNEKDQDPMYYVGGADGNYAIKR